MPKLTLTGEHGPGGAPAGVTISTDGLAPGKYVIDVVKRKDGIVFIGFVNAQGYGEFFRKVEEPPQQQPGPSWLAGRLETKGE